MTISTVGERLKEYGSDLTRSERLVADVILENYPASALGSITALAERANVSTPTVARLVQKLGFEGYALFQTAVREEVDIKLANPSEAVNPWRPNVPEAHVLNRVTESVVANVGQSLEDIDVEKFDEICRLLADTSRKLFLAGGRISRSLADHFFSLMRVVRSNMHFVADSHAYWMYNILDINEGDILLIFDVRRYENNLLSMARSAKEKGAVIILITDQWKSPIVEVSDYVLTARIAMPTGRDSMVAIMLLGEIIISQLHIELGEVAKTRTQELEDIFKGVKFFRRS